MSNHQIKLDINDLRHIRQAIKAEGRCDHKLFALAGPIVRVTNAELAFLNKTLENAVENENNWMQAQQYRETYGKISAQTHEANAKEFSPDNDHSAYSSPSRVRNSGQPLREAQPT